MSLPIQITVGGGGLNPVAGATEYNNAALQGLSGYVDRSGYGIWDFSNYQVLSTGGFRLLNGFTFSADEVWSFVPVGSVYNPGENSGYTNGFNYARVIPALQGRLGWMQTEGAQTLDTANLTSRSGRRFNDGSFHAIVTLKNVYDTMEQKSATAEQFNAYLTSIQRAIILRSLNGVFSCPEYVCQSLLYDRWSTGNNDQPLPNNGKFVGIQIKVPSAIDLAVQIDSVALYFDGVATFNLYVFNDVKAAPIFTKEVITVANDQTIIDLTDFVLNYVGGDNHGGIFYLGYFQDDLGDVQAIWETNVCFKANAPYGAVTIEADVTGSTSFNRKQIRYNLRTNGINPHISVFKDPTWQIIKKASLFDNLIGLQNAVYCLEMYKWTGRSNETERGLSDTMDRAKLDLDLMGVAAISDGPKTIGLTQRVAQESDRVKKAFQPKQKSMVVCSM